MYAFIIKSPSFSYEHKKTILFKMFKLWEPHGQMLLRLESLSVEADWNVNGCNTKTQKIQR